MLDKLTPEQEALIPVIRDKRINKLNNPKPLDKEKAERFVERLYWLAWLDKPQIIFVESPLWLQYAANLLKRCYSVRGSVRDSVWGSVWDPVRDSELGRFSFAYSGIYDYPRLSFYDFFQTIGITNHKPLDTMIDLIDCGAYDMIQLKWVCLVCSLPKFVKRDDKQRMHSMKWPAIKWNDWFEPYLIHWVKFDKKGMQEM